MYNKVLYKPQDQHLIYPSLPYSHVSYWTVGTMYCEVTSFVCCPVLKSRVTSTTCKLKKRKKSSLILETKTNEEKSTTTIIHLLKIEMLRICCFLQISALPLESRIKNSFILLLTVEVPKFL